MLGYMKLIYNGNNGPIDISRFDEVLFLLRAYPMGNMRLFERYVIQEMDTSTRLIR